MTTPWIEPPKAFLGDSWLLISAGISEESQEQGEEALGEILRDLESARGHPLSR